MNYKFIDNIKCINYVKKKKIKRPIVFTNGVFDIIHRGHIEYLRSSSKLGETLLVAINTDNSIKKLNKGIKRPINDETNRLIILSSLDFIDHIILFNEDSPKILIKNLKPDVIIKGGDYNIDKILELKSIKYWNGISISVPIKYNFSTTSIINQMKYL